MYYFLILRVIRWLFYKLFSLIIWYKKICCHRLGFWSVDSLFYVESVSSTSCLCLFSRPNSCSHVFLMFSFCPVFPMSPLFLYFMIYLHLLPVSSNYSGLLPPMFFLLVTPTPFALDYRVISWLWYSTFNHCNVEADKWRPGYNQNNSLWHGGSGKEGLLGVIIMGTFSV